MVGQNVPSQDREPDGMADHLSGTQRGNLKLPMRINDLAEAKVYWRLAARVLILAAPVLASYR